MSEDYPKDYLNNASLLREIVKSQAIQDKLPEEERDEKAVDCLTPELTTMIEILVTNLSSSYRWRGYTWIDDMRSEAILNLCRVALKFNLDKAGDHPNPFGYYTQIAKRVFLTYIEKEKKQGRIRDEIIESSETDLLPSFGRQHENETNSLGVDLDGTKVIPNNPMLRRRRKKPKLAKGDDTSKMDDVEFQQWLELKKNEFLSNGGEVNNK